jgi:hypothetical protein
MSGAEAALVLGVISSCITLVDASKRLLDAARDERGLPEAFRVVQAHLPLVTRTLRNVEGRSREASEEDRLAVMNLVESCERQAQDLHSLLQKVMTSDRDGRLQRYQKHIMAVGKGHKVEVLAQKIFQDLQHFQANHVFANIATTDDLRAAVAQLQDTRSSIDDEDMAYRHSGSGAINVARDDSTQNNHNYSGNFNAQGPMHIGPGTS